MTVARQKPWRIFILNNGWYQFKVIECFSLFGSLVLSCSSLDTDDQKMSKMQTKKQLKKKLSLKLQ